MSAEVSCCEDGCLGELAWTQSVVLLSDRRLCSKYCVWLPIIGFLVIYKLNIIPKRDALAIPRELRSPSFLHVW